MDAPLKGVQRFRTGRITKLNRDMKKVMEEGGLFMPKRT